MELVPGGDTPARQAVFHEFDEAAPTVFVLSRGETMRVKIRRQSQFTETTQLLSILHQYESCDSSNYF